MQQTRRAPRLITIGDAAYAVGVAPSTLRLWEDQGLIPPAQRSGIGARRVYQDHEIEALRLVAEERRRRRQPATAPIGA